MPVDPNRPGRILEHSYRESPAHEPHFLQEVAFPPLAAAVAVYLVVSVAFDASTGRAAAGAIMLFTLGWRLWRFDQQGRGVHIVEHTTHRVDDSEPRREWAPVVQDNGDDGNGGHRLRIGRWLFSESETRRLRDALSSGSVTRAALDSVTKDNGQRYFSNTSDRYQEYVNEFRRVGFIDNQNVLTPVARAWFEGRGIPLPPADA